MRLIPLNHSRVITPSVLALVGMLVVACTSQAETAPPRAPTPTLAPESTIPVPSATPEQTHGLGVAAEFESTPYGDESGRVIRLSDLLAEGKPLVINFSAPALPLLRLELPVLERAANALGDRVSFVFADLGQLTGLSNRTFTEELLRELAPSLRGIQVQSPRVTVDYEILGVPSTAIISADGELLVRWTGAITDAQLRELIAEHLGISG